MDEGTPLRKMPADFDGTAHYTLDLANGSLAIDALLGRPFTVRATGLLTCIACGSRVKKFYGQGFCYPCLLKAPEAAECIVRPELCRAHLGEGRDREWEREHHDTEHLVYLSHTGGIKVGVTRATQLPTRWIDQGAVAGLVIARAPYRQLAGRIEVDLKRVFADRTDWRAMLRPVEPDLEALHAAREQAIDAVHADLREHMVSSEDPVRLNYPVLRYPPKLASVQLAKMPLVQGLLVGVKGQYLIWEDGRVLNVRNHSGHHVVVEHGDRV